MYLFVQKAVPLWDSPWLIPLFLCSSTSSGISVVLLCNWFVEGKTLLLRASRPLQKAHVAVLIVEATSLAAFVLTVLEGPDASRILTNTATNPSLTTTFFVGVLGMGLATPLLLETYTLARNSWRHIPVSDIICLVGGFCLRWCLIMGGTH